MTNDIKNQVNNRQNNYIFLANFNSLDLLKTNSYKTFEKENYQIYHINLSGLVDESMTFNEIAHNLFVEISGNLYNYANNENKLSNEIIKLAANVDIKSKDNIVYKSLRKEFIKKNFFLLLILFVLVVLSFIFPKNFYQIIDFIAKFGTSLLITLSIFLLANYKFLLSLLQGGKIRKEVFNVKYTTKLQIKEKIKFLKRSFDDRKNKKLVLIFDNLYFNDVKLQKKIVSILQNLCQIDELITIINFDNKWDHKTKSLFKPYFNNT